MAKKKKHKGGAASSSSSSSSDKGEKAAEKPASSAAPASTGKMTAVEAAYRAGNYAAVRAMAQTDNSENAQRLRFLTTIDVGQVVVGGIALLVVIIVALVTLH